MELKIEVPEGKKPVWKNDVLTLVDVSDGVNKFGDIRDKIKTFADATKMLSSNDPLMYDYAAVKLLTETDDILAYAKLRIITAALNEGWKPSFVKGERRYYPYFYFYTKEQYDEMNDEDKKHVLLWGGYSSNGSRCGLGSALASPGWSDAYSAFSARLVFKNRNLALYAGRQFIDLYSQIIFNKH